MLVDQEAMLYLLQPKMLILIWDCLTIEGDKFENNFTLTKCVDASFLW